MVSDPAVGIVFSTTSQGFRHILAIHPGHSAFVRDADELQRKPCDGGLVFYERLVLVSQ